MEWSGQACLWCEEWRERNILKEARKYWILLYFTHFWHPISSTKETENNKIRMNDPNSFGYQDMTGGSPGPLPPTAGSPNMVRLPGQCYRWWLLSVVGLRAQTKRRLCAGAVQVLFGRDACAARMQPGELLPTLAAVRHDIRPGDWSRCAARLVAPLPTYCLLPDERRYLIYLIPTSYITSITKTRYSHLY